MKVYLWPSTMRATRLDYGDPNVSFARPRFGGGPSQRVAQQQRVPIRVEGEIWKEIAPDFRAFMERLRGGEHLIAFTDFGMRAEFGWDLDPAVDSNGNEFWRANGETAVYNGEAANPPTGPWRSIFADAVGAHSAGDTTVDVDGLLDSEVIPKGCMVRIGDFRHWTTEDVTANASGEATLTLGTGLREAISDNDDVRVPGDLCVAYLLDVPEVGPVDHRHLRSYAMEFWEVYESEIAGTSSPADTFEWQT